MPQTTSRWKIPYLTIVERPSIHGISSQIAAAADAALTLVQNAVDATRGVADTAVGRVDAHDTRPIGAFGAPGGQVAQAVDRMLLTREVIPATESGFRRPGATGADVRVWVPRRGYYTVSWSLVMDRPGQTAGGSRLGFLRENSGGSGGGGARVGPVVRAEAASAPVVISASFPWYFAGGGYLEFFLQHDQPGGTIPINEQTQLSLTWLRP